MAITVTNNNIGLSSVTNSWYNLQPVYDNNIYVLYDASKAADTDLYYVLDVSVFKRQNNSSTMTYMGGRTVRQYPDTTGKASIEINNLLEPFVFDGSLVHKFVADDYDDVVLSTNENRIVSYNIKASAISGGTNSSTNNSTVYSHTFNGVNKKGYKYNPYYGQMWHIAANVTRKFLQTWQGERYLHKEINPYVDKRVPRYVEAVYGKVVSGSFDVSTFNNMKVTYVNTDGSTAAAYYSMTSYLAGLNSTYPSILRLNVSPTAINNVIGRTFVDGSVCSYYTVQLVDLSTNVTVSEELKFKYIDRDDRYKYNCTIKYMNSLGSYEYMPMTYRSLNKMVITYDSYSSPERVNSNYLSYSTGTNNQNVAKKFNTSMVESFELNTGYMDEQTSLNLKELWISPDVQIYKNTDGVAYDSNTNEYYGTDYDFEEDNLYDKETLWMPIVLNVNNISVLKRNNAKPIGYTIEYTDAVETKTIRASMPSPER